MVGISEVGFFQYPSLRVLRPEPPAEPSHIGCWALVGTLWATPSEPRTPARGVWGRVWELGPGKGGLGTQQLGGALSSLARILWCHVSG